MAGDLVTSHARRHARSSPGAYVTRCRHDDEREEFEIEAAPATSAPSMQIKRRSSRPMREDPRHPTVAIIPAPSPKYTTTRKAAKPYVSKRKMLRPATKAIPEQLHPAGRMTVKNAGAAPLALQTRGQRTRVPCHIDGITLRTHRAELHRPG